QYLKETQTSLRSNVEKVRSRPLLRHPLALLIHHVRDIAQLPIEMADDSGTQTVRSSTHLQGHRQHFARSCLSNQSSVQFARRDENGQIPQYSSQDSRGRSSGPCTLPSSLDRSGRYLP
ncbi:hypothetical protein PENTCL1PPCAC_24641, partial [Pristionchus entomophagus]